MNLKNTLCNPLFFFLLTITYSWIFWFSAIFVGGLVEFTGIILLLLGGTGPIVVGIVLNRVCYKDSNMLVNRMFNPSRLTRFSFFGIILFPLIPIGIGIALSGLVFQSWMPIQNAVGFVLSSSLLLSFAFNLIATLCEEPGWRGYALDTLQVRWNALTSSLILSFFWALWHVPLFLMPGSYQSEIGIGTPGFWLYMGALPATTILITWVYNNSYRSVLSAILFHLINNLLGEIFSFSFTLELVRVIVSYVLVVLIISVYGSNRLAGNGYVNEEFVDYTSMEIPP